MRRAMPGHPHRHLPTAEGRATMLAALATLYGDGDPLTAADALALQEQLRVEAEDRTRRQGELHLVDERGRG